MKETAEITAVSKRKLSQNIHDTRRLKIRKKYELRQQKEEIEGEMRRREMALREREMTLREFQAGMTSTTSQRQGYDFHEAPRSPSQFPETEDQVPRSPSQFPEQEDEESILERTTDYDLDEEGQKDTPYYM